MPGQLRSRLRRVLTGQEGEGGPLSKIKHSKSSKAAKQESDFYQPGEKMPPLKYRRPVDPEHKKNLEAFSFKRAWRRRSHQSLYSPMGSRLPSRKGSFRSRRSRSRSVHRSRRSSFHSELNDDDEDETWVDSGIGASISGDERPANIREASDDEGDVLNVGLSRNPTQDPRDTQRKESAGRRRSSSVKSVQQSSTRPGTGSDRARQPSQPFSPEDLELALQKSHLDAKKLEATKEESDKSSGFTPSDDEPSPFDHLRPRGGSIFVPHDSESPGLFPGWSFVASDTAEDAGDAGAHYRRRESYFSSDDEPGSPQFQRRESVFVANEDSAQYQRRESVFVSTEDTTQYQQRESVVVPKDEPVQNQQPSVCAPAEAPSTAEAPIATENPSTAEAPRAAAPVRTPLPASGPSDEIMKILARRD